MRLAARSRSAVSRTYATFGGKGLNSAWQSTKLGNLRGQDQGAQTNSRPVRGRLFAFSGVRGTSGVSAKAHLTLKQYSRDRSEMNIFPFAIVGVL